MTKGEERGRDERNRLTERWIIDQKGMVMEVRWRTRLWERGRRTDECYGVALQTQSAQILPVNTGYRVVVFHMVYAGTDWRANQEYFKNGLGKVHCGHLNKLIPQTMAPDSCHPNSGEIFSPL